MVNNGILHLEMDGDVWEKPTDTENFKSSDSQWFILPEEAIHSASPLEILLFFPLTEEINLPLSVNKNNDFL